MDHTKFQEMCPSLVQQIESGICSKNLPTASVKPPLKLAKKKDTWQRKQLLLLPSTLYHLAEGWKLIGHNLVFF